MGRVGMVLIALSLALYLVSLIPQGTVGLSEKDERTSAAQTFHILYTSYRIPLNPQIGVQIVIHNNGTLNIKAFNLNITKVVEWLDQQSPSHNWNVTLLEEFVEAHQESLVRDQDIPAGNTTFTYIPSKIENSTIFVSNPTSTVVQWSYENKTITVIASPERIFFALMLTAPLGVVFSIPWLVTSLKHRRETKKKTASPNA